MLKIHTVNDAHGLCGEEVARNHAHPRIGHWRVGQALAEGRLDLIAQLAGGLLCAVERDRIGHADALVVARRVALEAQLFVHLRAKAVHQHDFDAHRLDQRQILHDVLQLACGHRFPGQADDKDLVAKLVDVGRNRAKPRHEGEVEDGGHGSGLDAGENACTDVGVTSVCRVWGSVAATGAYMQLLLSMQ